MLKKLSRRALFLSAGLLFAVLLGGYALFAPLTGSTPRYLFVDHDDTADSVFHKVQQEAGILPTLALRSLSGVSGYAERVRTGRYDMGSKASAFGLFRRLRNGSQTAVRLTIPIVRTSDDLADFLSKQLQPSADEFYALLTDSALLASYGKTPATALCLFLPNTYEIYWDTTPRALLQRMQREYEQYWTASRRAEAQSQGLTPEEAVTVASIVEQETAYNPEKAKVAGMYLNRLRQGMPLQADPTVKYALGNFTLRRILHEHLKADSPYNTYLHRGLPPGPICIPSMASLEAVLRAEQHSYIYMCAKEDFSGSHNFATTYAEHLTNAQKYSQALDRRDIR